MASGLASTLFLLGLVHTSALHQAHSGVASASQESLLRVPDPAASACLGAKNSFNAGYGGCEIYRAHRAMHKYCDRDYDEHQGFYASQVCQECESCSGGDHPLSRVAKSYGDPHMQNILGQRFDLVQPGDHTLVQIPRHGRHRQTFLRVVAQVSRVGASCQDMYIMKVNVTGAWLEKSRRRLHFAAGVAQPKLDGKWLQFGPVDLKVAQGKTWDGTVYLNFFVRNLAKASYPVGGLLGEDSHEIEATPTKSCHRTLSLLQASARPEADSLSEGDAEPTRSVAAALEMA